jgi:Ser/Thr protein kinase RdoA (MazF antagonist)
VLAAGEHILKAYGSERAYAGAVAGLRQSGAMPVRTPAFVAALPELRLTVQGRVAGAPPAAAADVAAEAGALAAALQHAALADLDSAPPERLLGAARRKAAVIAAVLPDLRSRLDALLRRLAETLPGGLPLVPAHGDFHADQLLLGPEGITLVDFDEFCRAGPALDIATYAADVLRGRADDRERLEIVLERLLAGFGARPAGLDWYLAAAVLGRAGHPFQRQVDEWPERTERMLDAAEAIA